MADRSGEPPKIDIAQVMNFRQITDNIMVFNGIPSISMPPLERYIFENDVHDFGL